MNPNHKEAIKERYIACMALKLDTEQFEELRLIRRRAVELGYTHEQVTEVFRDARNESKPVEQSSLGVPEKANDVTAQRSVSFIS